MSDSRAASLVRRFTEEVWNERRLDALDELVSDGYELRNLSDRLAADSRVVSVVRITGTHTGEPFQEAPAAGAAIDVALVAIFDSDGERLIRHGTLLDAQRLLQQLAP